VDGTYRTLFGFGASHNGLIYSNNDYNVNIAIRRLTGKRTRVLADGSIDVGFHDLLFSNQFDFFLKHRGLFERLRARYAPYLEDYSGAEEEAERHHDDPHAKRLLRIQAWRELKIENRSTCPSDLWVRTVLWKMKKNEWAKPRKKPRMIGDLGVSASLRGFRLTELLKQAQSSCSIEYLGGEIFFCKTPDPFVLETVFRKLIDPPGRFYFVYFSDDSCLSIRCGARVDWYNLDISSCDSSHGPSVFETLINLMSTDQCVHDMERLVAQCQAPLRVVSCADRRNFVKLKPSRPMLYSGSTITTAINNLANISIGLAIAESSYSGSDDIEAAAQSAGYVVTGCKPLECPEDFQFLKHSPVLDDHGFYRPLLNFGVLVRASGACKGDLPGTKNMGLKERAFRFQRGLLRSAYPRAKFAVLQRMQETVGNGPYFDNDYFVHKVVVQDDYPEFVVDEESFRRRYRLDEVQYLDLFQFASCSYERFMNNEGLTKVLTLDYGLKTTKHDKSVYNLRDHVQVR